MIKYLGSKRRLVGVLEQLAVAAGARRALDMFTGTTRVAQAFKRAGLAVTALDSARYAHVFARCYIEADSDGVDRSVLVQELAHLDSLRGSPGYVTETFCRTARFFHPDNGARIDAIRAAIEPGPLEPLLLTALVEAADRVDSTTGVQMAYLKQWAPRALQPLRLRVPELLAGSGRAVLGDAVEMLDSLGSFDVAYLDPPYNQHRYRANYHVWETLVLGDEPDHYGVACKRTDLRTDLGRSPFEERRSMPGALARCIAEVDAAMVMVSLSDESWVSVPDLHAMCAQRGEVRLLAFPSRRYVGAQIGVFNPSGERVGQVGRLHNLEVVALCGEIPPAVHACADRLEADGVAVIGSSALSEIR